MKTVFTFLTTSLLTSYINVYGLCAQPLNSIVKQTTEENSYMTWNWKRFMAFKVLSHRIENIATTILLKIYYILDIVLKAFIY